MDIKKSLGQKIKRIRRLRNFTQEQLAEMIEISPRNLSKIEVGTTFVKADTLEKLLLALNITSEELFANEHIKDSKELLADIYSYLNQVKDDTKKLEKIFRMVKLFVEDN